MVESPRILFVNHTLDPMAGGAERVLYSLLEGLGSQDFELHLAVPRARDRDELRPDVSCHRLPPLRMVPSHTFFNLAKTAWSLLLLNLAFALLLRRIRPDAIYVNSIFSLHFSALPAALLRIPFVYHEHNLVSQRARSIWHVAFARLARLATVTVAISEAVAAELREVGVTRIRVVHNAIEGGALAPDRTRAREPGEPYKVAQIANLHRWKGHKTVINAVSIARHAGIEVTVSFFGRAQDEAFAAELQALVDELEISERVHFLGFVENPIAHLIDYDSLVLASEAEPFGLAILEGMKAGIPVVATASGGALEIIETEKNGLLFTPNDSAALAECWRRLIEEDDLGRRLANEANIMLDERFSMDAQITGVADAIREALR